MPFTYENCVCFSRLMALKRMGIVDNYEVSILPKSCVSKYILSKYIICIWLYILHL